ncbi:carbohydrate ABC transporter permease [Phytohabitans rumicis]|uniref:carbohydrate ABC transporter permease n=1 Tax=Phytohabitans rumicis TaxID=1076125 RepID=UPI001FE7FADA|nr:sugar ABC transporter permease [Phytohabitans rumicis]
MEVVDRTAPPPAGASPEAGAPTRRHRGGRILTIVLFLLPALVLFGTLVLLPMLLAMYTSLFDWNGFGGRPTDFVGLENFQRLLTDDIFVGDLRRGLLLIVLSLLIQLPLSLGIAMLLNQKLRGRAFYRLLFFVPYVLSEVITGVLFTMVFSPNRGLAGHIAGWFGFHDIGATWLSDPETVMYSLFFVMTWKYFGFHMILYLAGRQSIPNELIEAAQVDGAGSWQAFRHVTLPLLGPTIRISVFLSVIGTIQLFDLVWVLTGGGPLHASETLAVTMFNDGFRRSDVGYASATSIVMLLISLVFALFYQRFIMRRDIEGAVTVMQGKK